MRYIMKFGGTSVANGGFIKIAEIVTRFRGHEVVVVVSAIRGVTDRLLESTRRAERGEHEWVNEFLREMRSLHREEVKRALGHVPEELEEKLQKADRDLEHVLYGILYLREATPRSIDYVASFGERYSAEIQASVLNVKGIKSIPFTGGEAGIVTDDNFGEASPLMAMTEAKSKAKLLPLLREGYVPVVGGYAGATQNGIITTLGRGGSDYTATILGAALSVDEVWIWSDVDGIMSADPKIVPRATTIPELSYEEALEMSSFGAKVLHPRALEPVYGKEIPVRIKNTFSPDNPGTLILKKPSKPFPSIVKAVAMIKDVGMITVSGASMVGKPGTAAKIFGTLAKVGINIMMISQSVSESNVSMVVKRDVLERAYSTLEVEMLGRVIKDIEMEDDDCVIAAVGAGMKGTPGVAARMFRAVADKGVNVRMIAQGSSELNVSFVVKEEDGEKAVRAIHEEFIEKSFSASLG